VNVSNPDTNSNPPVLALGTHPSQPLTLTAELAGNWQLNRPRPNLGPLEQALTSPAKPQRLTFLTADLGLWGSGLVSLLLQCRDLCRRHGIEFDIASLPHGLQRLLDLAVAVPPATDARPESTSLHPVERVGLGFLHWRTAALQAISFLGECTLSMAAWLRGRAHVRRSDLLLLLQQCGVDALPIVSLISLLVGVILAFVGAVQLARFGASIYVADLVAIAMTREMGCMMVAIVLCGRTGAAFAAQLGTMKVNLEIDAFRVLGVSPVEFLVLPRLIALFLMIPLLTLYADLVGIAGGFVVAKTMLELSLAEYWTATINALTLAHVGAGIVKSFVFGLIIAFTGCLRGLQCGTNAAAVGLATTSAVVTAITGVIAADAVFAVLFNVLGI
jgi:phospholipid/cholesterol/gamma-HCH transport system permease protein